MKKTLKALKYFIIILFSLIVILIVVAKLAENKIAQIALIQISKAIKAPVEIDDVDFTLLRRFPLATIELKGVRLGALRDSTNSDPSDFTSDTLVSIDKIFFSVKTRPLIKGEYEISKIEIVGADFKYSINPKGIGNFDFLMDTTQAVEPDTALLILDLESLLLKNISLTYIDDSSKMKAKLFIPELEVNAKVRNDKYSGTANGSIQLSDCSFEGTNAHLMKETTVDFNLDFSDEKVTLNKVNLITDGAKLHATGTALIKDTISVDIRLEGSDMDLSELIKYAPAEMLKEYGLQQLAGNMHFKASIKGMVADSLLPQLELRMGLKNGAVVTFDYPALKNIHLSGQISNGALGNNQTTRIVFDTFHFETAQSQADFAFTVTNIDHPKYDVKADMQLDMAEFKKYIPDTLVRNLTGKLDVGFSTKGQLPDSIGDDFTDYVLENSRATIALHNFDINLDDTLKIHDFSGQMAYEPNHIEVTHLNLKVPLYKVILKNTAFDAVLSGKLTQTNSMGLNLKSFHIETEKSLFTGSAKVQNFDYPSYSFTTNMKLDLAEIKTMLPDSLVNQLSGEVTANISSAGKINLDSIEQQMNDLVFESSAFELGFKNVTVGMPDTLMQIQNFTGQITMKPDTITIDKTSGIFSGIEFSADSTTIVNVYNTVIKNQHAQLYVEGNFHLGDLDYAQLGAFMGTDTSVIAKDSTLASTENKSENPDSIATIDSAAVNYTFLMKGKFSVNSLKYDKVLLEDISTKFKLTDSVYKFENFKFHAFNGTMDNSIKMVMKPDGKTTIETHHIIEKMDIKKLLADFDNFGDTSLTSENISGLFSTDLFTRMVMIGDSILYDDIRIKGDLKLEDGGVYNYQPAKDLAKFTNINELENIQFKTLESSIFMMKNKMYVPKTQIVSTAIDITAYGMQSMGEDYEYHIQLHLGDVLKGKSNKLLKEQAASGEDVSEDDADRNSVKLIYSLIEGKSKVGFDTKKLQTKMLTKIRTQEKILSLRFDNYVNFDTGVK
ncbi:MAG: AsmA-like C-terminal region-containing protein [Salinivirgaceae bacterium]